MALTQEQAEKMAGAFLVSIFRDHMADVDLVDASDGRIPPELGDEDFDRVMDLANSATFKIEIDWKGPA